MHGVLTRNRIERVSVAHKLTLKAPTQRQRVQREVNPAKAPSIEAKGIFKLKNISF